MKLVLKAGPLIEVATRNHVMQFATDGSLPNPLEAAYASIAGCAGVYAKKACESLGISDEGIGIDMRVVGDKARPGFVLKINITVTFPDGFDEAQQAAVRDSIAKCPVKALIQQGDSIEFVIA